jgi:hypothetical protein
LPVLVLSAAVAISALIGLSLSHRTTRSIAAEVGCRQVSTSHPQAGVESQTCSYHGDTLVILTLSKGSHVLPSLDLPDNVIIGTAPGMWIIGCQRRDDCVKIQRQVGGTLSSGPLLGLSLVSE